MDELLSLQECLEARALKLPQTARQLLADMRAQLRAASDKGRIANSHAEIFERLGRLEPPPEVQQSFRAGAFSIVGGDANAKNFDRDRALKHFKRNDGAWFDFTLTAREQKGQVELLAYDFEIRLPPGYGAPFLRFDFNLPGHANQERALRSHLHFGNDDLLVPAPVMSPRELLTLFIDGLRLQPSRKPRQPSAFELEWLTQSHQSAVKNRQAE